MKNSVIISKAVAIALGLALMHDASAAVRTLDRPALQRQMPGNTLRFEGGGDVVYEYLAPDGTIHGHSNAHGYFRARWRLHEEDLICFETDDPMQSGCVAIVLRGSEITFHRRDGVIEGPFEFLPGNPQRL